MSELDLHASWAQTDASLHRADDASTGEPKMQVDVTRDIWNMVNVVVRSEVVFTLHMITCMGVRAAQESTGL